jgi:hypothetical protein
MLKKSFWFFSPSSSSFCGPQSWLSWPMLEDSHVWHNITKRNPSLKGKNGASKAVEWE